jgi:hypothetical protein
MPALHRKVARLRSESFVAPSASTILSGAGATQEKLYSNVDVSKMVKDAVCTAVAHTKETYEKILQEKLAGWHFFGVPQIFRHFLTPPLFQSNINNSCGLTKTTLAVQ